MMIRLSSYINVYNTCLVYLRREGFELAHDKKDDTWTAKKGDVFLLGDNPIELLGLAHIALKVNPQEGKDNWWKIDEPDIFSELDSGESKNH